VNNYRPPTKIIRIIKVKVNISKKVPRGIMIISVLDAEKTDIGLRHARRPNTCVKDIRHLLRERKRK
jgi:hypothetical protein